MMHSVSLAYRGFYRQLLPAIECEERIQRYLQRLAPPAWRQTRAPGE